MPDRTCSVNACADPVKSRGMCRRHYLRWWRGYPLDGAAARPCSYCQAVFDSPRHDQKYCSRLCERRSGMQKILIGPRSSVCVQCGETFDVPGARGNVPRHCPLCSEKARRLAMRKWRKANPEKYAAQMARQPPRNTEADRVRQRVWYQENAELAARRRRASYLKHREKRVAYTVEYRRRNRVKVTELENRRRARKLAQFVAPVDSEEIWERDGGVCQLCGEPITDPKQRSMDHIIPISRGGTHEPANVQLAHRVCNSRKGNRLKMPA